MQKSADEKLSFGAMLSVSAVVGVLVLVSLPRLQAFALHENEADAAELTHLLGRELAALRQAPRDLAAVSAAAGIQGLGDDLEWLHGGRLLRRHGYLFELAPASAGAAVRAWPESYGATGRSAFLFRADEGLLRHGNGAGLWSGPGAPPLAREPGWVAAGPEAP